MTTHASQVVCRRDTWRGQVQDRGDIAEQATSSEAQGHQAVYRDQSAARKWAPRAAATMGLSIVAGVIVALVVVAAGAAMPGRAALGHLDAPVEIRVIESDLAEPFIVCTIRPQVTTCQDLDLSTDHR